MVQRAQPGDRILIGAFLVAIALVSAGHSARPRAASQQPVATSSKPIADDASIDARAAATEQQMTDDERFSLLISILGNVAGGLTDCKLSQKCGPCYRRRRRTRNEITAEARRARRIL
jgi:hypothetical protein